jgi:hypothetical protein
MDTDRYEQEVLAGQRAQQITNDPVLNAAHEAIEADLLRALMDSPQRDKEGQLELVALMKLNRRYRNCLQRTIESGKVAQERLSWLQRMQRRFAA